MRVAAASARGAGLRARRYDRRTEARPALLWMRTFHEHYDPLLAVEVLARVCEVHPGATMTMGGADHGLLQATRDRAAELGVADRITFAGYLDPQAKACLLYTSPSPRDT